MRKPYKHTDINELFSDFEHTPEDSNWNVISGGINSGRVPGKLAEKMEPLTISPNKAVWAGITAETHPNRRRKAALWWNYGAAASFISLVLLGAFVLSNSEVTTAYTPRENNLNAMTDSDQSDSTENPTKTAEQFIKEQVVDVLLSQNDSNDQGDVKANLTSSTDDTSVDSASEDHPIQKKKRSVHLTQKDHALANMLEFETNQVISNDEDTIVTFLVTKHTTYLSPRYDEDFSTVNLKDKLAASFRPFWLNTENGDINQTPPTESTTLLAMTQLNQANNSFSTWTSTDGSQDITETNSNAFSGIESFENFNSKEEYSTPVYLSLYVEKNLLTGRKNRWNVGSGLGYLLMKSTSSYSSSLIESTSQINRNYLAIPLYVKYEFLKKPRWNAYSTLGTTAELGLGGNYTTTDVRNGLVENSTSAKFSLGVGQFNVNGNLGLNFKLGTHLSAFTEVSLAHYFHQSKRTFWSSKSLWPGLKTGISVKF